MPVSVSSFLLARTEADRPDGEVAPALPAPSLSSCLSAFSSHLTRPSPLPHTRHQLNFVSPLSQGHLLDQRASHSPAGAISHASLLWPPAAWTKVSMQGEEACFFPHSSHVSLLPAGDKEAQGPPPSCLIVIKFPTLRPSCLEPGLSSPSRYGQTHGLDGLVYFLSNEPTQNACSPLPPLCTPSASFFSILLLCSGTTANSFLFPPGTTSPSPAFRNSFLSLSLFLKDWVSLGYLGWF